MDSGALLKDLLDRNEGYVLLGFAELTDAELRERVTPGANPIGWLMWHMTRVQDRAVADMVGIDQRWIADGWHARFGMGADPEQRGNGDSSDQVAAFTASAEVLVDYYAAVREQTNAFLDGLDADDPERQVPGFGAATVALAQRVPGLILETVQHGGQIAYVRGLVQGDGWQKRG